MTIFFWWTSWERWNVESMIALLWYLSPSLDYIIWLPLNLNLKTATNCWRTNLNSLIGQAHPSKLVTCQSLIVFGIEELWYDIFFFELISSLGIVTVHPLKFLLMWVWLWLRCLKFLRDLTQVKLSLTQLLWKMEIPSNFTLRWSLGWTDQCLHALKPLSFLNWSYSLC